MNRSEQINELAAALAKAQAEIKPPAKDRKVDFQPKDGGPRVKYSYADLTAVLQAINQPLAKNGLSLTQVIDGDKDGFGLETILIHSSGQFISTWYPLPNPTSLKPQQFGSSLTYGRRYSIQCLVGVSAEEDDDGADAQPPEKAKPPPKIGDRRPPAQRDKPLFADDMDAPPPGPVYEEEIDAASDYIPKWKISQTEFKHLMAVARKHRWQEPQVPLLIKAQFGKEKTTELSREEYDRLLSMLENMDPKTVAL